MTRENESAPAAATVQGALEDDRSGDAINIQDTGGGVAAQPEFEFHSLADKFPPMTDAEYDALAADIRAHGQREPIVTYEDKILDGRNRYRACRELGLEPWTKRFEDFASTNDSPAAFVVSANIHRRHLTPEQKQAALIELRVANPEKSDRQLAAEAGVAHTTMSRATKRAEATGAVVPVGQRVGADGKKRKQPKKLTRAQKAEQAERRRVQKDKAEKARREAIRAQLPDDIYDLLDAAETAADDFREYTVDTWSARAKETVDHAKAEAVARAASKAWTHLADGVRKKAPAAGNVVDPQDSAEARKAAFAEIKSAPAPVAPKKRGRPVGSKNKKKS
jgi:ParB-like chromosome segregation protein Spo0J